MEVGVAEGDGGDAAIAHVRLCWVCGCLPLIWASILLHVSGLIAHLMQCHIGFLMMCG